MSGASIGSAPTATASALAGETSLMALLTLLNDPAAFTSRLADLKVAETAATAAIAEHKALLDKNTALSAGIKTRADDLAKREAEHAKRVSEFGATSSVTATSLGARTDAIRAAETDLAAKQSAAQASLAAAASDQASREAAITARESAVTARENAAAQLEARLNAKAAKAREFESL